MSTPLEKLSYEIESELNLQSLEWDLDGVLREIAFTEMSEDIIYIKGRVRELKEKYGKFIEELGSSYDWVRLGTKLGLAVSYNVSAFWNLISEEWKESNSLERGKRAEEILGENGFLGNGF